MSPLALGFLKGLGFAVLLGVLTYLGDATHLTGVTTPYVATIIASFALGLENHIQGKTGNAFFGAIQVQK